MKVASRSSGCPSPIPLLVDATPEPYRPENIAHFSLRYTRTKGERCAWLFCGKTHVMTEMSAFVVLDCRYAFVHLCAHPSAASFAWPQFLTRTKVVMLVRRLDPFYAETTGIWSRLMMAGPLATYSQPLTQTSRCHIPAMYLPQLLFRAIGFKSPTIRY